MVQRVCELCGASFESPLVIRCYDCMLEAKEVKNKTERLFKDLAEANGWEVTKKGYPDFICYRDSDIVLVEVKKPPNLKLSQEQAKFMDGIRKYGIKGKVWNPSDGFVM